MYNNEFIKAFGTLVQPGVADLIGLSTFADEFVAEYEIALPNLQKYGYDPNYTNWQRMRELEIIALYELAIERGIR